MLHAEDRSDTWEKLKARIQAAYRIWDEYGTHYSASDMISIVEEWQTGKSHAEEYLGHAWHDDAGYVMNSGNWS